LSSARSYPNKAAGKGWETGFPVAAGIILLVGSGLRLYGITRESAWADELTTLLITDPALSFGGFWQRVVADTHAPLYYLVMRGWSAVFGQADLAARLPSAMFGILMVAAAGAMPLPRAGRLTLMALVAISPGAIEYAQEARSYALLLLLSTVVTGACLDIVTRSPDERGRPSALALLTVSGIIASYTHYFGFLFAVAAGIVTVAAVRSWRTALALAVIVASFSPWVIYHAQHISSGAWLAAGWMADSPLAATTSWFVRLWLGDDTTLLALVLLLATLLALPRPPALAVPNRAVLVGLSLASLTAAAAGIISWWVPILSARNLVVVMPALYLAMAALAADAMVLSRAAGVGGVAVVSILMLARVGWYYSAQTKEQWRESAAFVLEQPGCSRGPIHVYGDGAIYRYLAGKARPELELIEIPLGKAAGIQSQPAGDCPIALWAGKISPEDFAQVLSELPPRKAACRQVTAFYWAFVVTRDPADPACAQMP